MLAPAKVNAFEGMPALDHDRPKPPKGVRLVFRPV
jgi:hypothetical protein